MIYLIVGLALFFGTHFYSALRSRQSDRDIKNRLGEGVYMGLYSAISAIGLALIVVGYWSVPEALPIYAGPEWSRSVVQVAMVIACVLIVSAYSPANRIQHQVRHPMVLAITIWAGSHLLNPTDLKALLLFGSFFIFGIIDAASSFRRAQPIQAGATLRNDVIVIAVGLGVYVLIGALLHPLVIGLPVW